MSIRILILALTLVQATSVFAKAQMSVLKETPFVESKYNWAAWDDSIVFKNMKASEKKRKPANSSMLDESMMSKELRAIENKLHSIKTSEQMDAFLSELDKNYDSQPTDVKFYITQVLPTQAFRGMFFRLKTLFDGKSNFVHSQVITTAKSLATRTRVFLPYDHADAGYEYVSSPYLEKDGGMVAGFKTEEDVQVWMVNELLPLVNKSIQRLEKLSLVEPILWDQKMVFGNQSFGDNVNRFKMIGEFEKNLAISSLYGSVTSIAVTRSYNLDKAVLLYKDVGFLYGFDGFGIFNKIDGVSAQKITKVIKKDTYAKIGTLLPDGNKWMEYAYKSSLKSLKALSVAWELSSDERKDENFYVFNTGFINVNREETADNLQLLNRVMTSKDSESLRSAVTGEVVQVNYSKIFTNPPKDLKVFLPTEFDKKTTLSRDVAMADGTKKSLSYRNYAEGSPVGWNVKQYETYFPSIKSNDDVFRMARVLSHVQGNWLAIR